MTGRSFISLFNWSYLQIIHVAVIVVSTVGTYMNVLGCDFVYDDRTAILTNGDVKNLKNGLFSWDLWAHDFWGGNMSSPTSHKSYRPLAVLSLRLDTFIAGGLSSYQNHLSNVVIHTTNSLMVYVFALYLFRRHLKKDDDVQYGALFAAILFSLHPVHSEAVCACVGRADLLAGAFFLVATICYEMRHSFLLAFAFTVMGTLSKEVILALSGYLVFDAIRLGDLKTTGMLIVLTSIIVQMRILLNGDNMLYSWTALENHIALETSIWKRFCSYTHVHYIALSLMTFNFKYCYDYGLGVTEVKDHPSLEAIFAYALLLSVSYENRNDILGLKCILLAALPYVPASNMLFPIGTVLADRLLYIPSVGFSLFVGKCIATMKPTRSTSAMIVLFSFSILISKVTNNRNAEWASEKLLFHAANRDFPDSVKTLNNLAYLYLNDEDPNLLSKAKYYAQRGAELNPHYITVHHNLAEILIRLNEVDEAERVLHTALALNPNNAEICSLQYILLRLKGVIVKSSDNAQVEALIQIAETCKTSCPSSPVIQYELAVALAMRRSTSIATIRHNFLNALDLNKNATATDIRVYPHAVYNSLSMHYMSFGMYQDALLLLEGAFNEKDMEPSLAMVVNAAVCWLNLSTTGLVYSLADGSEQLPIERAKHLLDGACEKNPESGIPIFNLGTLEEKLGNLQAACVLYRKAQSMLPTDQHQESLNDALKKCTLEQLD